MNTPAKSLKNPRRAPAQTKPSPAPSRRPPTPVAASPASPERRRHDTRGRELLDARGVGAAELGRQLQCSRGVVHAWITGRKQPSAAARARLEALGIPAASWSQAPSDGRATDQGRRHATPSPTSGAPELGASSPAVHLARPDGGLAELDDLLAHVRAARRDPSLVASERLKAGMEEAKLLAYRTRLEHQIATRPAMIEDLCVRHPKWIAFRDALIEAIAPHRQAMLAVAEVLRAFGVEVGE
jgi:hypothetical protein